MSQNYCSHSQYSAVIEQDMSLSYNNNLWLFLLHQLQSLHNQLLTIIYSSGFQCFVTFVVNLAILLLVPLILLSGVVEFNRNEEQDFIQKTAHCFRLVLHILVLYITRTCNIYVLGTHRSKALFLGRVLY